MSQIPNKINQKLLNRFVVSNNTFSRAVKDNPKDKIELEIGDSKQPDFKPQAKISRWNNEVNFSIRAEEHPEAQVRTEGKLIKYITPEYEVHQYELDPGDIGEDGGLEFEWVLPKKPASNVLRATIQTKELNFFYQPPLTQEEIDQGAERPENVVGSYAVYHKTKGGMNRADGMEYKTGKAFHIYRPKVKDANGNEVWGELNIDEQKGELTVTIDQTWLDNAAYPVVVDPTFGYTSIGVSVNGPVATTRFGETFVTGMLYTLSESANVSSISAHVAMQNTTYGGVNLKGLIYSNNGGHINSRLSSSESGTAIPNSTTYAWRTSNVTCNGLSATDYYISLLGDGSGGNLFIHYDSDASYEIRASTNGSDSYTSPPSSIASDYQRFSSNKASIYATYTASAVPVNVTVNASELVLSASLPTATITTTSTVNVSPDSLSLNVSLPTPTITTVLNVNLTPDTLDLSVILPSSGVSIGDGATPAVLTQTFSIPSPTLTAVKNVSVNAGVLSQTFSLPTASVSSSTDVVLTPSQLDIAASIPSPTVSVVKNVSIAPTTLTNSFSVPSVGISIGDTTTPAVLSQTFTIPSPAVTAVKNVSVLTNTVSATSSIPSPTVSVVRNITVAPNPLVLTFSIPAETVVAEGGYLKNSPFYLSIGGGLSIMLGGQRMPVWNTQNRPTGKSGLVGYNREAGKLEIYDGAAWQTITVD